MHSAAKKNRRRKESMELTPDDIEILDRYSGNELTVDELSQLQSRMKDTGFSDAVKNHHETIQIVEQTGRMELKQVFTSIHSGLQSSGALDRYNPSSGPTKGKGSRGWLLSVIISGIIIAGYLFFSGKLNRQTIPTIFQDKEKIDTVYHYRVKTDTIIRTRTDTVVHHSRRKLIRVDTVYVPGNGTRKTMRSELYQPKRTDSGQKR